MHFRFVSHYDISYDVIAMSRTCAALLYQVRYHTGSSLMMMTAQMIPSVQDVSLLVLGSTVDPYQRLYVAAWRSKQE